MNFGGGNKIVWTYTASGSMIRKQVYTAGTLTVTREYVGGYEYVNNTLSFMGTAEGRAKPVTGQTAWRYELDFKDHLGNVRATIADLNGDGIFNYPTELIQADDYYPFGTRIPRLKPADANNYTFNGKEANEEFGLNWYHYGARFYDPAVGRWSSVDPLDEFHSPYCYVGNDPVNFNDPDGMETVHYDANWTQVGLSEVVWWQPWTWKHMGSNYTYNGGPIQELCTVEAFSENHYVSQIIVDNVNKISYKVPANKSDHIDEPLLSPLDLIGGGSSAGFRILSKGAANASTKLLNPGIKITTEGLEHVIERHTVNGIPKWAGKSKFTDPSEIPSLIEKATQQNMIKQWNGNFARIVDAGRYIGIDKTTGKPTSIYTVITKPNGELKTAFPGLPKK